jgi:predicted RNA-binding Zn ribbon-like protein
MDEVQLIEAGNRAVEFVFTGGRDCLDFANTVSGRTRAHPRQRILDYTALVAWGLQARLLTEAESRQLLEQARLAPAEAEAVYWRAIGLREAIYQLVSAHAAGLPQPAPALETLNYELRLAHQHLEILPEGTGYDWCWNGIPVAMDSILWLVARSAGDLLTSPDLERAGECQGDDCTWLFMDTSKNHSRRWCDMNECGNRAKAHEFYQRKRKKAA